MKNLRAWIEKILGPLETQFKEENSLEDIMSALNDPTVRKFWIEDITKKLQTINLEIDNLLAKEDRDRIWQTLAIERRTILRCLTMILDAKNLIESEREGQERQNRIFESYRGLAAPLNLDNRVDNRASDPQRS